MRRLILIVLLLIGVGLIVAPLSMSMFSRSSDGQKMVNDFQPIMQPANVETTAMYYDDVFTPLRNVVPLLTQQNMDRFNGYLQGIKGMESDATKLVPVLATALHMAPAQVQQFIGQQFPAMAKMLQGLPQMSQDFGDLLGVMSANVAIFQQVPAGLDHYKPLVTTMQRNVGTYESVDALPRMGLFPWFFIVPGILIVLGSGLLFVGDWRSEGLAATP